MFNARDVIMNTVNWILIYTVGEGLDCLTGTRDTYTDALQAIEGAIDREDLSTDEIIKISIQ